MDPAQFFVFLQLLVTIFLVVLLWCLYARLRKQEFFRWWAWAWTASAGCVASGALILRLGPAWSLSKSIAVLLEVLCGFLQVPLLLFGAWSLVSAGKPAQRWLRLGAGLGLAAGCFSFLLAFYLRGQLVLSFVLRSAPRTLALSVALFCCSAVFFRQWRRTQSTAAAISSCSCLLYGINQAVYSGTIAGFVIGYRFGLLQPVFDLPKRAGSLFRGLDVIYVCGICLGIVLLLVEEHRRAELALLESASYSREITANNALLQTEIRDCEQIQRTLKESEAKFRLVAETVACGIWIQQDRRFRYFSPQVEAITGYSAPELRSLDIWTLAHPDFREIMQQRSEARLHGETVPSRYQVKILTRGGKERWLDFSAALIQYEGRPAILASAFDITDAKRIEENLRHLTFRVMRIQEEERARIARELHDDISQRLGVLTFQLDHVWQESLQAESPSSRQLIALAKIAHQLCGDIQHLTLHLHPSHVEIVGLVSAVSGFCVEYARQNGFEVEFSHLAVPDELPQEVKLCLYRVAQEAIRNSHKHSGSSRVRVELRGTPEAIRLCITDAGRGFESDAARTGEGLGLVSMTERVKGLGGELRVQSRLGGGTSVEASIPLVQSAAARGN
ncbi:MAG TPA: PAS domain S-box protein [Candidatus Angelobacter sp.]